MIKKTKIESDGDLMRQLEMYQEMAELCQDQRFEKEYVSKKNSKILGHLFGIVQHIKYELGMGGAGPHWIKPSQDRSLD